ncbi:hypothetical protein KDI_56150 [Dictyobacter arantiisoli]|uniref:Uncharacterized protein n=1 Tax=Dictyobacter arantiisoli TaxID=2014874 RepID=A0A5A5TK90_9CHLR|nr:hypothetical protein KDI_56150 [Dictyobacter arantiisoli]
MLKNGGAARGALARSLYDHLAPTLCDAPGMTVTVRMSLWARGSYVNGQAHLGCGLSVTHIFGVKK